MRCLIRKGVDLTRRVRGYGVATLTPNTGNSYVKDGIKYEEDCVKALRSLGMDTRRTGGPGDCGIDLSGWWKLSTNSNDFIPIIVQCKFLRERDCPPSFLRELEGAVGRRVSGTVGVLTCSQPASRALMEALRIAPTPLLFLLSIEGRMKRALGSASLFRRIPNLVIGSRHHNGLIQPTFYLAESLNSGS